MPFRKYYRLTIPESEKRTRQESKKKFPLLLKIGGWLFIFLFLSGIGIFAYFASQLPNPEEFEERFIVQSTKIYDRTGSELLYDAAKNIKRTYVPLEEISPYLQKATIAAEDADFYKHPGIDLKATLRALFFDLFYRKRGIQGGSTITQQFIKNAMLVERNKKGEIIGPAPRTISRKIKEAILALEIERRYSKDKILEFYLNEVCYGSVLYGAEEASQHYFQKPAKDLTLGEAVTLASLTRSPTYYLKNPERREKRKNWILDRMVKLGFISKEEGEKTKKEKIALKIKSPEVKAPYFTREVEKQLLDMYGERYPQMGLKVFTTLDYNLQRIAEQTISEWSPRLEKWYGARNAALVSINPNNGEILVMVGGRNFKESEVNIWTPEIEASFQSPGSAFKPIVYATAFKKGYTPDTILWDVKTNFGGDPPYIPENYDLKQRGPVKMKEALAQSLNIPAVKTLYLAGINEVVDTAKSMGMIESFRNYKDTGLSMAIGGKDIVPLELVSAYGVFATEGIRYLPHYILRIENSKGEVIYQPEPHPIKVLSPEICREINAILSDNSLRAPMFGSRSWLNLGPWAAVKTGTSTNQKGKVIDAWTIGYTRDLVTGVWVGNNRNEPMYGRISGATGAGPIWNSFMKEVTKDKPHQGFPPLKKVKTGKFFLDGFLAKKTLKIDKISNKLATSMTPSDLVEEREFFEPHCILFWINKDDPQGEPPKNPSADPMFKNWEEAVQRWAETAGGKFHAPTEEDDIHTQANKPKIEIISKGITPKKNEDGEEVPLEERKVNFSIKITAPLGVKEIEVLLDGNTLTKTETTETLHSFTYDIKNIGEKEQYNFKIIVTDSAKNKTETELSI